MGMGDRIREAMDRADYSYRTLAPKMHVSPGTLHAWVKKGVNVPDAKLERLAKLLGVEASWLRYGSSPAIFDEDLLATVITSVCKAMDKNGINLPPESKGKFVAAFYTLASKHGIETINDGLLDSMLEAAKKE